MKKVLIAIGVIVAVIFCAVGAYGAVLVTKEKPNFWHDVVEQKASQPTSPADPDPTECVKIYCEQIRAES